MSKYNKLFIVSITIMIFSTLSFAQNKCSTKLFSVTINSQLSIKDVIDNLSASCGLTVIVQDDGAKTKMSKKLYYVKLKHSTLKGFLDTILSDNDLNYSLVGNKLKISYYMTKTFKIHYISATRTGESNANVIIANPTSSSTQGASAGGGQAGTDIKIKTTDDFKFWSTVGAEIKSILTVSAESSVSKDDIIEPIINPQAGMITVTGTNRQISSVIRYIKTLSKQIKSQVLIDVRILNVTFDDSSTTGVDWSQLYTLQNFTINGLTQAQKNISDYTFDTTSGITAATFVPGGKTQTSNVVNLTTNTEVTEVVKFLSTQGDVKSVSSPRIMTLNNQPALISVGKELFYKIKSSSTASTGGGAVAAEGETVNSVFAGILLDITPEIDNGGQVTLKINPSITDTVESVPTDGAVRTIPPDLTRRQIASVIKVRDGQHAILGGLISTKKGFSDTKVPLLGDIPLLGSLFNRKEKINTVEELVLIITPHIVYNSKSVSLKDLGYSRLNEK